MNPLTNIKRIYFIGIGGIGMSALARYFNTQGVYVSGYDKTPTPLTDDLQKEGIQIHFEDDLNKIDKEATVIVYTPAIPAEHGELNYYKEHGYQVVKRSDVLNWITENAFTIGIAGTHGKTTTTSMTAHILRDSGYGCNAFLGGIASNYDTNFWSHERNVVVVEADEYDRSFLKLSPNIAVITAVDPDHLDIYGTPEEVLKAFGQYADKIKSGGTLIQKWGTTVVTTKKEKSIHTYGYDKNDASFHTKNLKVVDGSYIFDVVHPNGTLQDITLNMGGLHNVENATAAIAIALTLGIDDAKIKQAVSSFKGVKRRFEYKVKTASKILIDDYAHHPEELNALITGVRSIFPNEKMVLVFQPHLYSRTQDQCDGFVATLDQADEVILLPIYPARELPIPGVTSEMLLRKMTLSNKKIMSKEELLNWAKNTSDKLIVMAGAGDIDACIIKVQAILNSAS
ncbi:MAG: UDP-N-acetylmuramate--L-alanine ligase [Chitinophagia bacterium]|jgi:UDP-N-acetylmuramate--alanine ligase|nr:UDP-N-acetylmuramate--L-alanine ligase [Chitinophagia bacterium]